MDMFTFFFIHLEDFSLPIQIAGMVMLYSLLQSSITKIAMKMMH